MVTTRRCLRSALILIWLSVEFLSSQAVTVTTTDGDSGDICPPGPQCLGDGEAACINDKCRCQAPAGVGLGHFLCVRSNEVFCAIFNDPIILSYDGSTSFAPMSCKFKPTHLLVHLCDTSDPDNVRTLSKTDSCDIKVSAWGTRRAGKTFIQGIEVRFMVMYDGSIYHHLSRIISNAAGGVYTFLETTNTNPFGLPTAGPAQNTTIPGLGQIYTEYDRTDNFARVIAEMCGVEVGIRGVDSVLSPMERTAGAYIKVNSDCNPKYVRPETCLCSPPAGQGDSLFELAERLSDIVGRPVSLDIATFYKIVTGTTPQVFPGAAPALQELMDTAVDCRRDRLVEAIEKCIFIIDQIKFLKCYDKTDNLQDALALMNLCLFSICDNNGSVCRDVQELITASTCDSRITQPENTIMTRTC